MASGDTVVARVKMKFLASIFLVTLVGAFCTAKADTLVTGQIGVITFVGSGAGAPGNFDVRVSLTNKFGVM
jgi:hypothetical protein